MLKIRLRQFGKRNRTTYRLVVTDVRAPRDGKYLEMVGTYNPLAAGNEKELVINEERVAHWLGVGAQMTERARTLIKKAAPGALTK